MIVNRDPLSIPFMDYYGQNNNFYKFQKFVKS